MNGTQNDTVWQWPREEFLRSEMDQEQELIFSALTSLLEGVRGASILEPGSGTALISHHLARAGARVTLCDLSDNAVRGAALRFKHNRDTGILRADLLHLPFASDSFDIVWNAGVMEHFAEPHLLEALQEMARVSRRFIAVFVPFLDCLPYWIAKLISEHEGTWKWGLERPKRSLRIPFEQVAIDVIDEYEFGWETDIPLSYLKLLPDTIAAEFELDYLKRGYFTRGVSLATVGVKRSTR